MADRPLATAFRNPKTGTSLFMALPIGSIPPSLGTKLREIGQAEGSTLAQGSAA